MNLQIYISITNPRIHEFTNLQIYKSMNPQVHKSSADTTHHTTPQLDTASLPTAVVDSPPALALCSRGGWGVGLIHARHSGTGCRYRQIQIQIQTQTQTHTQTHTPSAA
jgi:hypothetical protein